MDIVSYILSKAYVDKTLDGMGALKGAPCTISSIVDNPDGTHDITFSWQDNQDPPQTHTSVLTVANGETPTITSTEIEGGHTLTFATTNPSQTVSFNVMDGLEGQRGVSVIRANVDNNNYLTLELSDGNIINAGQIKTVSMVDNTLSLESANPVENRVITSALNNKVNKVSGKQLSTEDFTTAEKNKLANIENGAQVNTLENLIINGEEATIVDKKIALNIITSAVSNLQNYYLKTETYTKQEVEELIGSTVGVTIEIVQELPTVGQTNVIYFLPTETANVYSQYIYTANDGWVLIGSTSVDLSNYYTKGQVDTLLNGKQNVLTIDAFPTAMSNNPVASGGVYSAIAQMQPQFQFTNMPVASQSNYGFVYQYVGNAGTYEPNMFYRCVYNTYAGEYRWEEVIFHATVTVDSELSPTSTNPVQNKVVKEALDAKQDIMQFSTMPSAQDNLGKIVQYTGATTATYQNACFYKAVYDSEHDVYVWTIVKFSADISVDNVLSDVSENPVQNKVITNKFGEYKTAFTGTEEEWDALTSEEQNVYDIMNITNDGDVLNLGIYLEKTTAMPVASEDEENKIYLYTGTTTQNYKKGVVYQCVSDGEVVPTYSWVALIDFGTAAIKNSTDRVSPNNTDLVESQSVYSAINTALSSIYTPRGDITCAELTSSLLISDNIGNVYETSDSGTTTALFLQGAGHPIAVGSNVGIINAGEGRILFNLMANAFDLTSYQKKDLTSAVEGQTTVEGALGALSTNKQSKTLTTAVESETTVEGALGALSSGKVTKKDIVLTPTVTTSTADIIVDILSRTTFTAGSYCGLFTATGRWAGSYWLSYRDSDASNGIVCASSNDIYRIKYNGTNWTAVQVALMSDVSNKADKVSSATNGDLASLDANGNLVDSGVSKDVIPSDASVSNKLATQNNALVKLSYTASDTTADPTILNNLLCNSSAIFQWGAIRNCNNTPVTNQDAEVIVETLGSYGSIVTQIAYNRYNANNHGIYIRGKDATGWGNWRKLLLDEDITSSVTSGSTAPITSGGVYNAIYKTLTRGWNQVGNRFIKLSNAYPTLGINTNNYVVSCRNGETYLLLCGTTDGGDIVAPQVYLLYSGTGKLGTNGFYYDSTTKEIVFMTQGYNNVSVSQISGEVKDIILSEVSETNPLSNPVAITPQKLVTESDLSDVFRVYEYTSSNAPTKASFLTLLASSNAHMDFKFINVVTDYMPNSSSYWYVQKFGGMDALHIRLLATDWVSGDLYTGDANSSNNTITWWRLAGTQV